MRYIDRAEGVGEDPKTKETLFDKTGSVVISKKEKSYAKIIATIKEDSSTNMYYLKSYENVPYDPWGMHCHRESHLDMVFKKVDKPTFDFYMMYLKTKNNVYMTRCQRSFIND